MSDSVDVDQRGGAGCRLAATTLVFLEPLAATLTFSEDRAGTITSFPLTKAVVGAGGSGVFIDKNVVESYLEEPTLTGERVKRTDKMQN